MKKLKFFIALTVCATVMVSCTKDTMLNSAQDAEHGVIARSPGGIYSDYIITPEEAMNMVDKDLQESGGEFAQKHTDYVEPLLFSDFEFELKYFEDLAELDIIKMSDPLAYIVYFDDDGYALMTCDKDFGVEILHVQTGGTIAKNEAVTSSILCGYPPGYESPYHSGIFPHFWADLLVEQFKQQYGWKEEIIIKWSDLWRMAQDPNWSGGPSNVELFGSYQTYQTNEVQTSFWLSAGYPLNQYGTLGTLAPAVLELLGYHEYVNTIFGITGNWSAIKSWHGTAPAPQWAWDIQNYCYSGITPIGGTPGPFSLAKHFLSTQCVQYQNAKIVELVHDDNSPSSGNITDLIAYGNPVLVRYSSTYGLAYKEELQESFGYWSYTNLPSRVRYSSKIWYNVSLQDKVETCKTVRHALEGVFHYIAY